jgi:predicted transcriptional regulator
MGRVSSVLNHEQPWFLNRFRLPSQHVNATTPWNNKVTKIIEETEGKDVRAICGLPIWIQNYFQEMLLEKQGTVLQRFPNLQLFIHGGLSIKPYIQYLNKLIGDTKNVDFIEVYNASEGFFAFQDNIDDEGLLLHLNTGIFYEFIETNRHHLNARIPLWEVKMGIEYELVISTISGILGYRTGDTIIFTSTKPYKIIWTGRTKFYTSAFNEHIILEEVESAIGHAIKETSMGVIEFTMAPKVEPDRSSNHYDWYIEFDEVHPPDKTEGFAGIIDHYIQSRNHLYRELREAGILQKSKITLIQKGGFYQYMKEENKLGDQYKVVHLSNNRSILNKMEKWIQH